MSLLDLLAVPLHYEILFLPPAPLAALSEVDRRFHPPSHYDCHHLSDDTGS